MKGTWFLFISQVLFFFIYMEPFSLLFLFVIQVFFLFVERKTLKYNEKLCITEYILYSCNVIFVRPAVVGYGLEGAHFIGCRYACCVWDNNFNTFYLVSNIRITLVFFLQQFYSIKCNLGQTFFFFSMLYFTLLVWLNSSDLCIIML